MKLIGIYSLIHEIELETTHFDYKFNYNKYTYYDLVGNFLSVDICDVSI